MGRVLVAQGGGQSLSQSDGEDKVFADDCYR